MADTYNTPQSEPPPLWQEKRGALSYKVNGDGFLPLDLVQDASIVAKDVHSSKRFCNFLKSNFKKNNLENKTRLQDQWNNVDFLFLCLHFFV